MDKSVVHTVRSLEETGKKQYKDFGQVYIAMQNRQSDLNEFFAHEIQSFPPSLSDVGMLYLPGTKSDLLPCLGQCTKTEPPSTYDCKVLDESVIVHCLSTSSVSTFNMYADKVFIPLTWRGTLNTLKEECVGWIHPRQPEGVYSWKERKGCTEESVWLNQDTRQLEDFFRWPDEQERAVCLFNIQNRVIQLASKICVTSGQAVPACGLSVSMDDCNHEEADTRVMVHIRHALEQGAETVLVRTVDTDVMVIQVGLFFDLVTIQPSCDFWIAFGMGKNYRLYHINSICESLGEPRSRALPVFHAFSGCDTTSAFNRKGKKSLWQAWQAYDDAHNNICLPGQASIYAAGHWLWQLSEAGEVDSHTVWQMESFVLRQSKHASYCFVMRTGQWKNFPIPKMLFHVRRAVYQAGISGQAVQTLSKHFHLHVTMVGWRNQGHPRGYQSGWLFLRCQGHAGNSLKVVVKGHAPLANVPK